jgi:dimethylaniline monooxygenase (N-oxide forming)
MPNKRICVIGAGASGIVCIKECIAAGFSVVCYEKVDYTGGLWRYHESDTDGIASVTRATIINSSKEMSAYSDFPPPKELPNYCHNSQLVKYFDSYADKHGVKQYVKFLHEVVSVVQTDDYILTGRWNVTVKNLETDKVSTEEFDAVCVCTGHHVKPMTPTFKGQDKFKGRILHTHSYKRPVGFDDKDIVVVGIGNSGGDASVELSAVARQVYLSTRRGSWILYRVGPFGTPFDMMYLRRIVFDIFNIVPYSLSCATTERFLNSRFDHKLYGLEPSHHVWSQHPMVNDALPNRILSGTVIVKGDIQEFTEDGVIFEGESEVTKCAVVVMATGYEVSFPFLDKSILDTGGNEVPLYKYMFQPKLMHPETLAFIALTQPVGPLIPIAELQSRWFCQIMLGNCKLPCKDDMFFDIKKKRDEIEKRYYHGAKHTMQVDWVPFMDEIASQFGAKPKIWKYFFTDPALWASLIFGPCVPYHFRLDGPGAWAGAREAILTVKDRTIKALSTRPSKVNNSNSLSRKITAIIAEMAILLHLSFTGIKYGIYSVAVGVIIYFFYRWISNLLL